MIIQQIYEKYKIMPQLQKHQLRVAAVAQMIYDNFDGEANKDDIIKVCLLHDMGNIVKFDFLSRPDDLRPEGLAYWESVRTELKEKYHSDNEHEITSKIAEEIGLSKSALETLDLIGFSSIERVQKCTSFEAKICAYADYRVGPDGVVSVAERIEDGRKRYANNPNYKHGLSFFENLDKKVEEVEQQIFAHCSLLPADITDKIIDATMNRLKETEFQKDKSYEF